MPLAVFDLDDTLIDGDSATLWLHWLVDHRYADPDMLEQEAALMQRYRAGLLRMEDYMALSLQPLAGHAVAEVDAWVQHFIADCIGGRVYPQGQALVADYQARGWRVLLISATADHLVMPIARHLGIAHAMGIQLQQSAGRYTGHTHGVLSYQAGKVERLRAWVASHRLTLEGSHGYSDSINDLPLLQTVDRAHVVNPCQRLEARARLNRWPVLRWQRHTDEPLA